MQVYLGELLTGFPCTCKCIYMDVVKEKAFSLLLGHILLLVDVGSRGWDGFFVPCSLSSLGAILTPAAAVA